MYYNRTISKDFANLLETGGKLRWLFDFVKNRTDLDFLIGKNNTEEWISIYRGLSRIIKINPFDSQNLLISAAEKIKNIMPDIYGKKSINENFQTKLEFLITKIEKDKTFDRYYSNKKEGFYQNELSKLFGTNSNPNSDFVIIDKEAVIGYSDIPQKASIFGSIQQNYKQLQKDISLINPQRYGAKIDEESIGNELDFLALDKAGNILLIEYKHGTNTSGIYLSPLQIGLYYDIFSTLPKKDLEFAVFEMLEQKQKIGLINKNWSKPACIKDIIPVLIISEYNYKSSSKTKFDEILQISRNKFGPNFLNNIQTYNYTQTKGLTNW